MTTKRILFFFLLSTLLTACGQTGPLYLPDDSHAAKKTTNR